MEPKYFHRVSQKTDPSQKKKLKELKRVVDDDIKKISCIEIEIALNLFLKENVLLERKIKIFMDELEW